jgi:hypothetical protein
MEMKVFDLFLTYAGAFEQTVVDDDWERVVRFFDPKAIYEIESRVVGARLVGPDAICAGIRRSLDGFDRRFDSRRLEPIGRPEVLEDGCRIAWKAHYQKSGVEDLTLRGSSLVRFCDGLIVQMVDTFTEEDEAAFQAWQSRNASFPVDLSYVG